MTTSVYHQVKVLLKKNHLQSKRNKEYFKEAIMPALAVIFYILYGTTSETSSAYPIFQSYSSVFGPMSTLVFLRNFLFTFTNEKTEKYKETYKIMGMQQSAYFISWLIFTALKGFAVVLVVSIAAIASGAFESVSVGLGIGIFIMFMMAQLAFAYFFSTFFSQAKMAAEVYTLIILAQIFMFYLLLIDVVRDNLFFYYLICLLPSSALNMSMYIDDSQFNLSDSFTGYSVLIMLIFDTIFYFSLYLYLDQVFPNEFGTQKPWYFPFQACFSSKKQNQGNFEDDRQSLLKQDFDQNKSQDYSSAQYHEQFSNPRNLKRSIEVMNFKKRFGDFYAVDGVSLCLYEQQIFCLLGHNGAGKTTTISLLTGMLELSSGKASLYDKDLVSKLDEIRKDTGICNQKDVLFDNLTVTEHLQFMCDLKGIPEDQIPGKIEESIWKCNLELERHKYSKNLSGGNKRKLSLAISLIGGSRIVFLDEPSSGLDPGSRRKIWDILKQCKQENRTIVLTTHHLEEAEELADRIGIMSRGKLLTVGTSEYIKKKFGIGYQLILNKSQIKQGEKQQADKDVNLENENQIDIQQGGVEKFTEEEREYFKQLIQSHIKTAQYNPQTSQDKIQFSLPFDERPQFPALLEKMEADQRITINLEMNSLEDAFINIGMEEQREEEDKKQLQKLKKEGVENPEEFLKAQNQAKFTNFENIPIPEILKKPPNVTFWVQFYALYLRKFYSAIRTRTLLFAFIMPIIFIFFGVYVTQLILKNVEKNSDEYFLLGGLELSIFLNLGYGFSTGSYCAFLVGEKVGKLKYALNVMGCRSNTYWLGTYAFDITVYLILQAIYVTFCYITGFSFVTQKLFWNLMIMIGFGFSYVACCHLQSHLFTSIKTAQSCSFIINFYLFFSVFFFTLLIESKFINTIASIISPYYLLFYALICVGQGKYEFVQQLHYISSPALYFGIFLLQAIIFMAMTMLIDNRKSSLTQTNVQLNQSVLQSSTIEQADNDIKEEERRIKTSDDVVKVQNLYKTYPNGYLAIKNNSFGVNKGEIFGLLGPNGAGKSTTFNILTSLIPKTSGSVTMKGIEVNQGIMEIYENVGICPQFDCIWESLNVEEHLQLFGRMKGLTGQDLNDSVEYFLQVMQLTDYRTRKSGKLSGGNKRKLCVALALIGGPDMQFCDEPSSGVDPIARRFLWNTLTNSIKLRNSSITITTHSMMEADSLCNKIGILVNGKFQCIGTPQYLKQKYGQGYIVTFKTNLYEEIGQIINNKFPKAKVQVSVDEKVMFQYNDQDTEQLQQNLSPMVHAYAQFPYDGFSFAEVFLFFEKELFNKSYISDFNVTQSSLEQIFLEFSKNQKVMDENKDFKEKKKTFLCLSC